MNDFGAVHHSSGLSRFYQSLTLVLFLIITYRFFDLQIISHGEFKEISSSNATKTIRMIPPRGDIYDRNGELIVTEKPAFSLYVIPALFTMKTFHQLAQLIHLDSAKIWRKIGRIRHYKPVKIYRQIPEKVMAQIVENSLDFEGLEIRVEPRRRYRKDVNMSHVLGTLGEVSQDEAALFGVEEGDVVGKKAVERYYDKNLRGEEGYRFVTMDARGRMIASADSERIIYPQSGKDLYLTIDLELQQLGEQLFQGKRGAMVVIDVQNGEILSLVSSPTYNLDLFTGRIQTNVWQALVADSTHPLYDRAIQSTYPPGSTFKLVSTIAALQEKVINPGWSINCPGYFRLGRKTIRCWKSDGHGEINLEGAVTHSCNVFFYQLGLKIGLDTWEKYSKIFRFGKKTGIDIYGEKGGLVPSVTYYNRKFGKHGWTRGNLANLAIGQGELLVTPVQMAQFMMILANHGSYYIPHVRKYFYDKQNNRRDYYSIKKNTIPPIKNSVYEFVLNAMREVVTDGTARILNIPEITVAGKTGTAQNPHGDDHAWFVGFAPIDTPELAFAVIVENGGHGGSAAAPIIRAWLKRYVKKYWSNDE